MNVATLIKRLDSYNLLKKNGEVKAYYQPYLKYLANNCDKPFKNYGKRWIHSCGSHKLETHEYDYFITIFNALKINYTTGNDAPRKGAEGDYIEVSRKDLKKLECLKELF